MDIRSAGALSQGIRTRFRKLTDKGKTDGEMMQPREKTNWTCECGTKNFAEDINCPNCFRMRRLNNDI